VLLLRCIIASYHTTNTPNTANTGNTTNTPNTANIFFVCVVFCISCFLFVVLILGYWRTPSQSELVKVCPSNRTPLEASEAHARIYLFFCMVWCWQRHSQQPRSCKNTPNTIPSATAFLCFPWCPFSAVVFGLRAYGGGGRGRRLLLTKPGNETSRISLCETSFVSG